VLRSKILAGGLAVLLACTLTACEKPKPEVTVTSGTSSTHGQALCWSENGAISAQTCAQGIVTGALSNPDTPSVKIVSDETISISVDPKIAESGWYAAIGDRVLMTAPVYSTYYRFSLARSEIQAEGFPLQIIAQSTQPAETAPRGIWVFKLINK
jgi:hypothetical protein